MNLCPGELILKLVAWIGEWHKNLNEKTVNEAWDQSNETFFREQHNVSLAELWPLVQQRPWTLTKDSLQGYKLLALTQIRLVGLGSLLMHNTCFLHQHFVNLPLFLNLPTLLVILLAYQWCWALPAWTKMWSKIPNWPPNAHRVSGWAGGEDIFGTSDLITSK